MHSNADDSVPPISPATAADRGEIRALLVAATLPTDDLDDAKSLRFWVARADRGRVLGVIGLEQYANAALLRSLTVAAAERRRGLGARLVAAVETEAKRAGVESLYLLTTTAERFFLRRGYRPMDRTQAPQAIGATAEFSSLCPSRAVCLSKQL